MVPWLLRAFKDVGDEVKEIPGEAAHPRIQQYHLETTLKATSDEVPWCSAAMCCWMEESGIPSTRSAAARSWMNWGVPLEEPREGCVVVFWRGSPDASTGHVALYLEDSGEYVRVVGGNQGDRVCVSSYHKKKILGYRWPDAVHYKEPHDRGFDPFDS